MKKRIAILGSTGSIGKTLIEIIKKDKKNFDIILLTADKNYKEILKQARALDVKNLIITNKKFYLKLKKKKLSKIKIFNNYDSFHIIFKKKTDYVMSSISGINGLEPTIKIISHTKQIAIANKEAIICGWNLIKKELDVNKTKFSPVDSEHFSIWHSLTDTSINKVEKIYLTASGGPFHKYPLNKFKNINIQQALNHPNWKMGKKISIDSATMMNKVFEVIEARNIFQIPYDKIKILIHPSSYVHALIKFNNGLSELIIHDTSMEIPIFNTLYSNSNKILITKKLNLTKLNNLDFKKIDYSRYPLTKILKSMPKNFSLFETILVTANDEFVKLFLNKKIKFIEISKLLIKFIKLKEFNKYTCKQPRKIEDIIKLANYVRFKIGSLGI